MSLEYEFKALDIEHNNKLENIRKMRRILRSLDPGNSNLKITIKIESDSSWYGPRETLNFVVTDKNSWLPMFRPIQKCLNSIYVVRLSEAEQSLEDFRKKAVKEAIPDFVNTFIKTL